MRLRMCSQRLRNLGISPPGMLSATGTRGSLTMPHSMASMSEKSLIVQGNRVPCVARTAQEERCGRQVDYAGHAEFTRDHFKARDPDARGLVVLSGDVGVKVAREIVMVFPPASMSLPWRTVR